MSIDKVVKQAVDNAYAMGKRDGREETDRIIAVLRAEVNAWRRCADIDPNDFAEEPLLLQHAVNMRAATDAAGALEE